MKKAVLASTLLLMGVGNAMAACETSTRVSGGNLASTLSGNVFSGSKDTEQWQEVHCANGQLWELAKGSSDPVDPTHQVGSWSTSAADGGTVTHSYTGGPSYTWTLHTTSEGYAFCTGVGGSEVAAGSLSSHQGCP
jgi:hypothetical protein